MVFRNSKNNPNKIPFTKLNQIISHNSTIYPQKLKYKNQWNNFKRFYP